MENKLQHRDVISWAGGRRARLALLLANVLMATGLSTRLVQAQTYTVLYSFKGGVDGAYPFAGLVLDKAGNLYGTTSTGGKLRSCGGFGCGTLFKLDVAGNETILSLFSNYGGASPRASLVTDEAGNLYGTTYGGGCYYCEGAVFKLNITTNKYKVLHGFEDGFLGLNPMASLVRDADGNLYGTTSEGGAYDMGTIFELDKTQNFTVLYNFTGGADGAGPHAGLILDMTGNLYGTTHSGGDLNCNGDSQDPGCGTLFKLDKSGAFSVLYSFTGADGASPMAGLVRDKAGNLYGTTQTGGHTKCRLPYYGGQRGCGTVFKLGPTGKYRVLHKFSLGGDGAAPSAGLVRDLAGNLYGTTQYGGDLTSCPVYGCGTVFKLDKAGTFTVLHSFTLTDGSVAIGQLVRDATTGDLYGTTELGGAYTRGVVFKLTP